MVQLSRSVECLLTKPRFVLPIYHSRKSKTNNNIINLVTQKMDVSMKFQDPGVDGDRDQEGIEVKEYDRHLKLLKNDTGNNPDNQVTTPIFSAPLRDQIGQYGLLAGQSNILAQGNERKDPRLFYNIAAPFSTFICGSQGSGKSHTLSCFLENCLARSYVNRLKNPLSVLLFHYDGFIGDM